MNTLALITIGLGLFLYGVFNFGNSLVTLFDQKLKNKLHSISSKPWQALLIGLLFSALIHSSSATIAITIAFVCANLLTKKQAINILLGANIGTTISSMIVIISVNTLVPFILIIGVVLSTISYKKTAQIGQLLFNLSLIFFGLEMLGSPLSTLANEPFFSQLVARFATNLPFATLIGTLVTGIIQSSTAFIGILQKLFPLDASMPLDVIMALLLGANIGTTFDGYLAATCKKGRQVATFNLLFNLISSIAFIPFIGIFTTITSQILTNCHIPYTYAIILLQFSFNLISVAIAFILVNYIKSK